MTIDQELKILSKLSKVQHVAEEGEKFAFCSEAEWYILQFSIFDPLLLLRNPLQRAKFAWIWTEQEVG